MDIDRLVIARTSGPTSEPVSLTDAKTHLRVDHNDDDSYIQALIAAAREWVEQYTSRALITQTWTRKLDGFPSDGRIVLPRPPLQSVSSITYLDGDGVSQTLSSGLYDVHTDDVPGRISRGYGDTWPITRNVPNAVTVTYVAGYGASGSDVPAAIQQAIQLLVGQMYAHREPEVTGTIVARLGFSLEALLSSYRVWWF